MRKFLFSLVALLLCMSSYAAVTINQSGGWFESAYVEWAPLSGYSDYNAYIRPQNGTYQLLDKPLLRSYGTYYRADALGLAAGNYQIKIVPVQNGQEVSAQASETSTLQVAAHDRNGFAHFNYSAGVGAYTNNGTLKPGAKVLYVHAGNAKTISTTVVQAKNAAPTLVTGMQAIITAYQKGYDTTPIAFRLLGTIDASDMDALDSSEEGLQIKGKAADSELNFTIEGVGNDAVIRGFGFLIRNAKSVEMRNFAVMTAMDDCISLDTDNSNIWVHHIDGFYGKQGSGDKAKGDGCIDVKSNSKFVTVSYNHFWDTGKSSMCGMKSESGPNYITYHHNWFDHSDSRHPRVRTMSVHVYNNYFDGNAKYCVGVTTGACAFVENNYFRACPKPMLISMQGTDTKNGTAEADGTFSGEDGGIIKAFNNTIVGQKTLVYYNATSAPVHFDAYLAQTRGEQVPSTVTAKKGGATYNNFDTNSQVMYAVTPDAPENVPAIVTGSLGAGRAQHGDFSFTFTNSDDSSYDLNQQLVAAIAAYTSSLDSIFGETMSPTDTTSSDTTHHGGTGDHECYILNGAPTSSFYTFTGCSFTSGKGTVTVDGTTYTECVKMESATNISFTTTEPMTLFLAFDKATANIKIDGTKVVATNGTISYPLAAGAHALTKADSNNLYYINLYGNLSALRNTEESGLGFDGMSILNPQGGLVRLYTMNGACLGSTTSTVIGTENLPAGWYVAVTASGALKFRKN